MGDRGTESLLLLLMECCPNLTSLDIGRNNLGQGMSGDVASVLETMLVEEVVPLKVLSLSYNSFQVKHIIRFARAFHENTFLTELDLSWNSVGDDGEPRPTAAIP